MLKKLLTFALSAALVVPAFSFSSLAASGDVIKVGDQNVKLATDFENFDDGLRIGQGTNKTIFDCSDNTDSKGGVFQIKTGTGANGSKGLFVGAVDTPTVQAGLFTGCTYKPKKDAGVMDYSGATDAIFWIDGTINAQSNFAVLMEISCNDYNKDGTPATEEDDNGNVVPTVTTYVVADNTTNTYYTMEDGSDSWTENTGTKGSYVTLSNTFKGYVRIPLKDFVLTGWSTDDQNGKLDLDKITGISLYYGLYGRDVANGSFYLDDFGFAGDFQVPTTTTETTATETTATSATDTTATSGTATTATAPTVTTVATSASDTTATVASETDTTAATTDTTAATESPKTGEMPITAALLTAVTFAGVLFAAKKKSK